MSGYLCGLAGPSLCGMSGRPRDEDYEYMQRKCSLLFTRVDEMVPDWSVAVA